ncbi:hypothetical protein TorRG33x02_271300 [Trema orientale]|uniref:Uncharacterized protein n=1 Tax=Trema orientale TaxID=63057 RepID=A0A2P5CW17_TREOI|nr:hypothetical protein TorRG33x02_271300 [Trema orientale]
MNRSGLNCHPCLSSPLSRELSIGWGIGLFAVAASVSYSSTTTLQIRTFLSIDLVAERRTNNYESSLLQTSQCLLRCGNSIGREKLREREGPIVEEEREDLRVLLTFALLRFDRIWCLMSGRSLLTIS